MDTWVWKTPRRANEASRRFLRRSSDVALASSTEMDFALISVDDRRMPGYSGMTISSCCRHPVPVGEDLHFRLSVRRRPRYASREWSTDARISTLCNPSCCQSTIHQSYDALHPWKRGIEIAPPMPRGFVPVRSPEIRGSKTSETFTKKHDPSVCFSCNCNCKPTLNTIPPPFYHLRMTLRKRSALTKKRLPILGAHNPSRNFHFGNSLTDQSSS